MNKIKIFVLIFIVLLITAGILDMIIGQIWWSCFWFTLVGYNIQTLQRMLEER